MSDSILYDEDILLWSEQQAAAIRRLGRSPGTVPNDLDIENVAEEIESVGRSELAAVKSYLRLILVHLIKLAVQRDEASAGHWRGEIVAFHSEMMGRYAPSMRQRIDLDEIWRSAKKEMMLKVEGGEPEKGGITALPVEAPYRLDELLSEQIDGFDLAKKLR